VRAVPARAGTAGAGRAATMGLRLERLAVVVTLWGPDTKPGVWLASVPPEGEVGFEDGEAEEDGDGAEPE
jgi:hypothetical protein